MGSEDKTPVERRGRPQTPAQGQHAPYHPHTNPYGVPGPGSWPPFTPWQQPEDKKKEPIIPEWLKFAVTATVAAVTIVGVFVRGGAILQRFETLEKEVRANAAQTEVREKQRELREQMKDVDDAKWREDMTAKLSRLSITRNRSRRASVDE